MAERSFQASGITSDDTKYGYILGALNPQYAAEVRDIIMDPPASGPYQKLKTELIRRLSSSQEQRTRRLLEHEEMGDRKPAQFLRHLRRLAGKTVTDSVLRTLWLGRLPTNIQVILATQKDVDLDKVAELADAVAETVTHRVQIAETTPVAGHDFEALLNGKMAQLAVSLRQEISAIREELISERRPSRHDGNFRPRSPSQVRSRSDSRNRRHGKRGVCWYHWAFDADAQKCVQPCTWSNAGNERGSH
ncbi:PREDICTED: uncharacterized protein LOC108570046 [Habropoda laboriosa]|nr:PREDICTED: uncharacterized protein LOC108570046 [Habropoda laboriosa]